MAVAAVTATGKDGYNLDEAKLTKTFEKIVKDDDQYKATVNVVYDASEDNSYNNFEGVATVMFTDQRQAGGIILETGTTTVNPGTESLQNRILLDRHILKEVLY